LRRIKVAYEHLVEKNEVYQLEAVHKCGCGYSAVTLRDLERHRQCGSTRYYGRGSFSCNRFIWCCYCNDDVPYTVKKFSKHMTKTHNVEPRICLPVINQCPFCGYNRHSDVKALRHIKLCRALFRPNLNLLYQPTPFDMPLQPKFRHTQPSCGTYLSLNLTNAGGSVLVDNRSAVSNLAAQTATSLVVVDGVPVNPVALYTGVTGHAFAPTTMVSYPTLLGHRMPGIPSAICRPRSYIERYLAPPRLPVVPVGVVTNRFAASSSLSTVTSSCALSAQKRYIYSSGLALNSFQSACGQMSQLKPSGSVNQQITNVVIVKSTEVSKNNVPNTTSHDIQTSSSLRGFRVLTPGRTVNFFTPASVNAQLSKDALVKTTNSFVGPYVNSAQRSGKMSSTKIASSDNSGSVPASSEPSISSISSKKPNGSVSSAKSPVVVLDRLSVLVCEVCGSVFEKPQHLCFHLQKAHGIAVSEKDFHQGSPSKAMQCFCCSLRFFSKRGLSRHMRIVHELSPDEYTCSRCSQTGIVDPIEHFLVKHNVTLRTMVEWRVCYLCKLNFTTVTDVEKHVVSAHANIFPSPMHFRQAVRASVDNRNSTNTQAQMAPVNSQHLKPVSGVNRKRHHSVIEIDQDSSDLNLGDVQKHKQQSVVDVDSGNEPVTKKARQSSNVSAGASNCSSLNVETDQSETLLSINTEHEQHSVSALGKGAVLGTVLPITKNERAILLPHTKERTKSCIRPHATSKLAGIPHAPVRPAPLHSVHDSYSAVSLTKETTKSSGNNSSNPKSVSKGSVRITPIISLSSKPAGAGTSAVSVRLTPLNSVRDTNVSLTKESRKSSGDTPSSPSSMSDVSVCIEPLNSLGIKPSRIPDISVRCTPLNSTPDTNLSAVSLPKKSTKCCKNTPNNPAGVSEVSVCITPLSSLGTKSAGVPAGSARHIPHDTDSSAASLTEGSRKSSANTTNSPASLSEVSARVTPVTSLHSEESSVGENTVENDKGRYRFVQLICYQQ